MALGQRYIVINLKRGEIMRHIFFILVLFSCAIGKSQKLNIQAFYKSQENNIAQTSPRYDLNDNKCAAIIIMPEENGELQFRGMVVGKVEKKSTRYILYMPMKTKRLYIYHSNYMPLQIDFTKYEDSSNGLEGGCTYCLSLVGDKVKKKTYPKGAANLIFVSNVPLKKIVVNGLEWLVNGKMSKRLVQYGEYNYEAYADGYLPITGTIEVVKALWGKSVNLNFVKE